MSNWSRWPPRNWEAPTTPAPRAVFTAIGTWLTATFGSFLAGIIANLAVGAALLGASALFGTNTRPQTSTPQAQATLNQSSGPRIRGYGRGKLGGTRAFFDSYSGTLYQIVMAHHGKIDAFEQFFVGDLAVTLSSTGQVLTSPLYPYVWIVAQDGATDQVAQPLMVANWFVTWTSAHRLRGIANWLVLFGSPPTENFQLVYPESYNTPVTCICRMSRVWDPRDPTQDPDDEATWKWSDTAALCILDYLRHPDGYRRSLDDIDVPSFIAKANIDDQLIPLAAGGTEKRYRIWGIYSLTDDPQDVLMKMRAASDAEFYQTPEGKVAIRGGAWQAPTVTLAGLDILGHSMEQGNNRFAAFNELKILFTSQNHDFQTVEATSWVDLVDQEMRGPLPSDLHLDMVPSASQARRLAKIHIAKSNPAWKGTIATNLVGLNALGERSIRLILPELGIDDAFFVAGLSVLPDLTGVEISIMSISEASYTWTTAEEGAPPAIPQDTRPDLTFPIPQGLVLSHATGMVTATVDDPARDDLDLQAQIRAGAGSLWQEMQVNPGALTAIFGPVSAGTYQVRARWRGPQNTAGEWTAPLAEIVIP